MWGSSSLPSEYRETFFQEAKRSDCRAYQSYPSSAKVRNAWSFNFTPPTHLHGCVLRRGNNCTLVGWLVFCHLIMFYLIIMWNNSHMGMPGCSLCLTNHHEIKTYWGSGGICPWILDLDPRWRWVVRFTILPLYPWGRSPRCPLVRRLGGLQSRSERDGEEKNS
jgi:hypothetical protein